MRPIPLKFHHDLKIKKPAGEPILDYDKMNLLTLLWRTINHQLFMESKGDSARMIVYLKDPRSGIKQTSKARSSEQSNLKRGLASSGMTVKNFTKGLRTIRPSEIIFKLTLEMSDGRVEHFECRYDDDKLFSNFSNKSSPNNFNFLRILWDQIYERFGFDEESWRCALTKFLNDPKNGFDDSKTNVKSSERSNLRRGLCCPNMTIENFTKALLAVDPVITTFGVYIHHERLTYHEIKMRNSSLAASPFDKE